MNYLYQGDALVCLNTLKAHSVDLIFTSPPYFNARPQYASYSTYVEYLSFMQDILRSCFKVLKSGRFIVLNVSPVLLPRSCRAQESVRLPLMFDFHSILADLGFIFIDSIIWEKPIGAGYSSMRGLRFIKDRQPLQYKPLPTTEYLLVYRAGSSPSIESIIHAHSEETRRLSKVYGEYERTEVWRIAPAHNKVHPAVFPIDLCNKVISYYSFYGDTVLDPFAGSGTVGVSASQLGRSYILIERDLTYIGYIRHVLPTLHVFSELS